MEGTGSGPTWSDAPLLSARLSVAPVPARSDRFRLGDGYLDVRSADAGFRERLGMLYRECLVADAPADGLPHVRCTVRTVEGEAVGLVSVEDGEPLDAAEFILQVFPDRGYREVPSGAPGWRVVALGGGDGGSVALSGDRLLFRGADPWRALAGSLAVSRLIRLQRRLLFFHAASVGVAGSGLLVVGPKGAGKTTLSLALAALGHAFLGDEIAGVRLGSLELVPLRRSLAIRTGPRAESVSQALGRTTAPVEIYPDGSERLRAQPAELFPGSHPVSLPLKAVVFLGGFAAAPAVERFEAGREQLRELTPMGATLWGMSPARRAFDMLSLLSRVRCYRLVLGDPEETAACIVRIMEE
jgi:hypothetical protein